MAWFQDCSLAQSITVSQQHYSLSVLFTQPFYVVSCCRSAVSSAPCPYWKKAAGHRLSETGKTSPCARLGIWCFSPFVTLQSFKVIVIQCNGGKATEYKGITPVQNSKKKESISTVRLILMSAALLFNHAISPTYTVFQLEKQRISSSQVLL